MKGAINRAPTTPPRRPVIGISQYAEVAFYVRNMVSQYAEGASSARNMVAQHAEVAFCVRNMGSQHFYQTTGTQPNA